MDQTCIVSRPVLLPWPCTHALVYNTGKMGLVSCCGAMCLGHESAGVIVQLGSNVAAQARRAVEAEAKLSSSDNQPEAVVGQAVLKVGTRVTLEPGVTCRMCHDCRGGRYNVSRLHSRPPSPRAATTGRWLISRYASTWHLRRTRRSTGPCSGTTSCKPQSTFPSHSLKAAPQTWSTPCQTRST